MKGLWHGFVLLLTVLLSGMAHAQIPSSATCIAPAQPDGGFDLTCHLLAEAIDGAGFMSGPVRRTFLPGGVGAVAFDALTTDRRDENGTLVAFSEGSIYNLALGRYGDHGLGDVRWLAQVAQDHGAVVVLQDAPWPDLRAMLDAMRALPQRIAIGGGGTIAGQDWMRIAMTAELAGIDHRKIRFVAFEGAGSCTQALLEGFVQACMNDVADARTGIDAGKPLRILAVYAPERLGGPMAEIPTAREQDIPLDWPVMRGIYMGPGVSDEDFAWWQTRMRDLMNSPEYADLLRKHHLQAAPLTGAGLDAAIAGLARTAHTRSDRLGIP